MKFEHKGIEASKREMQIYKLGLFTGIGIVVVGILAYLTIPETIRLIQSIT